MQMCRLPSFPMRNLPGRFCRSQVWRMLLYFADEMLAGTEPGRELSIQSYGELSMFYRLEQGMEDLYLNDKGGF